MKPAHLIPFFIVFAALTLLFTSCSSDSDGDGDGDGDNTGDTSDAPIIEGVSGSDGSAFTYTKDFGTTGRDVYFIFTNPTLSNITDNIYIQSATASSQEMRLAPLEIKSVSEAQSIDVEEYARTRGIPLKDRPELIGYDNELLKTRTIGPEASFSQIPAKPSFAAVGDTHTFYDYDFNSSSNTTVAATLRSVVTTGGITVNFWVADDAWGSCSKINCMDETMITAYAEKFLKDGSDNDIYDWVTNLFGVPWGSHTYSDYIPASAASEIDILFYDISNDDTDDGGIVGFFWSKDNAVRDASDTTNKTDISNERLIFYMDSVMAASAEDSSWEITDAWPAEVVSTLAHELQHMIHFYQKSVVNQSTLSSETWLNEMASQVAEDLVASKIGINGPRGVTYNDFTAGPSDNAKGRMPYFKAYNYWGLIDWYGGDGVYVSYAISYAFGAYLARNYGGAELFQNIVQNSQLDYRAVTDALSAGGYTFTLGDLLKNWGVAVMLSDTTDADTNYVYNTGTSFDSTLNGIEYQLGSINVFNYYGDMELTDLSQYIGFAGMYKTSNKYCFAGTGITGSKSWTITMPADVTLTVVAK